MGKTVGLIIFIIFALPLVKVNFIVFRDFKSLVKTILAQCIHAILILPRAGVNMPFFFSLSIRAVINHLFTGNANSLLNDLVS